MVFLVFFHLIHDEAVFDHYSTTQIFDIFIIDLFFGKPILSLFEFKGQKRSSAVVC